MQFLQTTKDQLLCNLNANFHSSNTLSMNAFSTEIFNDELLPFDIILCHKIILAELIGNNNIIKVLIKITLICLLDENGR